MSADLAARFRRLIEAFGPLPVTRFMGESNALYYAGRDPLGMGSGAQGGDFTTAPEISQMFGELIGLWLADVWDRAGRPGNAAYAELGPGRGTLARDALRAMASAGLRPDVHLVEGSSALRAIQTAALPAAHLHPDPASLPEDRPLLLVANEFLDALPIRQLVRTQAGWSERMVGLRDDRFVFVAGTEPLDQQPGGPHGDAPPGTIVETCPGAEAVVEEIARRLARQGGAALLIDYGHLSARTGSTLQAVRAHRKVDPLATPGEADLTAHVDFAALAALARTAGCHVHTATQGAFLLAMGVEARAQSLARAAPSRAAELAVAQERLVSGSEMGNLFKVMALTAPGWPSGVGVAAVED